LVEDHRVLVDLLSVAIDAHPSMEFVGAALRLADLPRLLLLGQPADVVLVDHRLPDGYGSDAMRLIRRSWPRAHLLLFTSFAERSVVEEAAAADAIGFISKESGVKDVLDSVLRAASDEILFSDTAMRVLSDRVMSGRTIDMGRLTSRERMVMQGLFDHDDIAAVASDLGISEATVLTHLRNAKAKLGVTSRLDAVSAALRAGLINTPADHRPLVR
jgi:DNA-binding NarL/FixJ family response regulator